MLFLFGFILGTGPTRHIYVQWDLVQIDINCRIWDRLKINCITGKYLHITSVGGIEMIKMMELPYPIDALEPYYSKETLQLHYEILYKGYVDNTNKIEEKLIKARESKDFSNIKCLEKDLSFQGSGAILHKLFFENLGPALPTSPNLELMEQIIKDFGSYEIFKEQFSQASIVVEASGWCLLVWVPEFQKLEILQCEKHQNLTLWGCVPLLVLDMWEHSYYLQYKTKRLEYVEAFWNIVNWNEVNKRFNNIK